MAKSIYIYIVKCLEKGLKSARNASKIPFSAVLFPFLFSPPRFSGGKSQWYGMPLAFPAAGGASRLPRSLLAAAKRDGNLGVLHFSRGFLSGRCRNRGGAVGIRKMPGKGLKNRQFRGKRARNASRKHTAALLPWQNCKLPYVYSHSSR